MSFRKTIFWLHLLAGLIAGIVIAVMSFTGTALAFEKEIIAWAERDVTHVAATKENPDRLSYSELAQAVREEMPDARITSLAISRDPQQAVAVGVGRETYFVNPYTGDVQQPTAKKWRAFFRTMEDWHRWLGRDADSRAIGRAFTGACNAAFLFLAVSGVYLWFPRRWSGKAARMSVWFVGGLRGRARDWNWHNVIGAWSSPILIVLTLSGVVMSYRWANDLVYKAAGSPVPAAPGAGGPAAGDASNVTISTAPAGTRPLDYDAWFASVEKESPSWDTLTLRLGNARGPGAGGNRSSNAAQGSERAASNAGNAPRESGRGGNEQGRRGAQPVTILVKEKDAWPKFASTTVTLDPYTGAVLKRESFADSNAGRRARSWLRFLHTGEALGWPGQLIAGLASLGGCFLVWTGFALAWRRFFGKRNAAS